MMKILTRLGLYNLNWNQIRQTWNFNRFLVVLGVRVRVADTALTTNLGQPSFSFYEKVLVTENPARVVLVYEDRASSVIAEVEGRLDALGIPYAVKSSSFEEDLAVLLGARSLVTAQGTLAEALLLLSPHLTRWIHFGKPQKPFFRSRGVDSVVSIVDRSGEYSDQILKGNWTNSDAQRSLMMSFPGEKLELVESQNP